MNKQRRFFGEAGNRLMKGNISDIHKILSLMTNDDDFLPISGAPVDVPMKKTFIKSTSILLWP